MPPRILELLPPLDPEPLVFINSPPLFTPRTRARAAAAREAAAREVSPDSSEEEDQDEEMDYDRTGRGRKRESGHLQQSQASSSWDDAPVDSEGNRIAASHSDLENAVGFVESSHSSWDEEDDESEEAQQDVVMEEPGEDNVVMEEPVDDSSVVPPILPQEPDPSDQQFEEYDGQPERPP